MRPAQGPWRAAQLPSLSLGVAAQCQRAQPPGADTAPRVRWVPRAWVLCVIFTRQRRPSIARPPALLRRASGPRRAHALHLSPHSAHTRTRAGPGPRASRWPRASLLARARRRSPGSPLLRAKHASLRHRPAGRRPFPGKGNIRPTAQTSVQAEPWRSAGTASGCFPRARRRVAVLHAAARLRQTLVIHRRRSGAMCNLKSPLLTFCSSHEKEGLHVHGGPAFPLARGRRRWEVAVGGRRPFLSTCLYRQESR